MLVSKKGNYKLDAQGLTLHVYESSDGLMYYNVAQSSVGELLKSSRGMASSSRWFMEWEPDASRLWVYSGDIGTVVWIRGDTGVFSEHAVFEDVELIRAMPREFYEPLPRVLKEKWPRKQE